jgi:hypothetical protein
MNNIKLLLTCISIVLAPVASAFADNPVNSGKAPDSTLQGPHDVASAEYRFPASTDQDVLPDRMTEIWGKVFYPKDIESASKKTPLIVMLHGNHATCGTGANPRHDNSCEYTESGMCPKGSVPVPNHEGYDYLAKNLASWGYVVTSINANRGITCGWGVEGDDGLNLARGRLVLKHLSLFYKWNTEGGAPASLGLGSQGLIGKIDFSSVGLLGHSRGGEGVRAAYNLYLDQGSPWQEKIPGLSIKAIYEIGAVDGQTSRVLDANGTVWNQLLPMCDGDVSDLEGRYPFERMLLNYSENPNAQKSLYEVWGANHNFFNTEWQSSDSYGCSAGTPIFDTNGSYSEKQQNIALASVPAFFRSHLGPDADPAYNKNFNPLHTLPDVVTRITQVDRDFTPSPGSTEMQVFDDFDKDTGVNSSGNQNLANQIEIKHINLDQYRPQRVATIIWNAAGPDTFFEAVWAGAGQGRDVRSYATLDFRIARMANEKNTETATDFDIALEDAAGLVSKAVHASDYAIVNGPGSGYNNVLQTVRVPLTAFQGIDLSKVHGVKFIFDKTRTGALYLGNIRLHKQTGLGKLAAADTNTTTSAMKMIREYAVRNIVRQQPEYVPASLNKIRSIRVMGKSFAISGKPAVEISLASQVPFPVTNRLPVLQIGDKKFTLSRYTDVTALKELTFTLTQEQYNSVSKNSEVTVSDGKIWKFGSIAQSLK